MTCFFVRKILKKTTMKKILLFTFSCLIVSLGFSQSDKQLSHYMFDNVSFNPGATGYKGFCGSLFYRDQWEKVDGAPNTFLLNAQGNIQKLSAGVGLSIARDVIGFQSELDVKLNFAKHFYIPRKGHLSLGLGLGIINTGFQPKWVTPDIGEDPNLPLAEAGSSLDLNFGVFWRGTSVPYYLGISATHLTQPNIKKVYFEKARHYYVTGGIDIGYNMLAIASELTLKPSFLLISEGVTTSLNVSLLADYWLNTTQGIWGGLSYRTTDAVVIMLGFQTKLYTKTFTSQGSGFLGKPNRISPGDVLKIGYSYDVTTSKSNVYSKGSHEIMLSYCVFPPAYSVSRYGNPFILQ